MNDATEFDIRGELAAALTCWHRLTCKEATELVAFVAALRAQPASKYLCNATRFKVAVRNGEAMLPCLPDELDGRWVALVAAEDDCHLRAQPDHSDPFAVMGNPISPHRELIAELRKPMHYLSMTKRNRAADALEGL